MSTRGWYEYYIIEEETQQISLGMQFYKWGDAVPENAWEELQQFEDLLKEFEQRLPIHLMIEMLKENLGKSYSYLPKSFPLGCYFFFLQRAAEELSPHKFFSFRIRNLPETEHPLYQFGKKIGLDAIRAGYPLLESGNKILDLAYLLIIAGRTIKKWGPYSLRWTFLHWIQYLTQLKDVLDMGSIAGEYEVSSDISYLYRFFFYVPTLADSHQKINKIRLEICSRRGENLITELQQEIKKEKEEQEKEELKRELKEVQGVHKKKIFSLKEALKQYTEVSAEFLWKKPKNI